MPRNLRRILLGLVVLVIAVASVGAIIKARSGSEQKTTYKTAKVERGDVVSSVSATGVIQPLTTVEVKSNVGGRINLLTVDVGSRVKKDQIIAQIDPTDPKTQLDQAVARMDASKAKLNQAELNWTLQKKQSISQIAQAQQSLAAAKARMLQAERQYRAQPSLTRASIAQAQANLNSARENLRQLETAMQPQAQASAHANFNQAQANLVEADTNLKRQKELLAKGFVPQSTVDAAIAQLATAQAQVDTTRRKLDTVDQEFQAEIDDAKARMAQAQAQLDAAQINRIQNQIKAQDYAAAKAAVEEAEAQLQLAYANKQQIDVKQKDIVSAKSDIVSNKAALDQAQVNMGYTEIRAPRDAIVLSKPVEQGTVIASSRSSVGTGPTIVVLGDISRMFILCQVDETDISGVEEGQHCDITVDAYPNELFEGKVKRIDPQAIVTQNVTTIPVTVEIDDPDIRLKPQMNANVEFITAKHEGVLTVPNEAIKEQDGRSTVQVMINGKPVAREVEVGIAGPDTTEITSGLKEGEEVVTQVIEPEKPAQQTEQRSPFQQQFGPPRGGRGFGGGGGGGGGGRGGGGGGR
jgi:HlyD family secretion protein